MRLVAWSRGWSSSGFSWLEHDDGSLAWSPCRIRLEVLADHGPSRPQALALVSLCAASMDRSCSIAGLGNGVGMSLQVQPPGGFGRTPPVHRHGDQVALVLEVTDDHVSRLPRASARRGESCRTPAVRLRPPQPQPAAGQAQEEEMSVPEEADEPARRQPDRSVARCHRSRVRILAHDSSFGPWHYRLPVPNVTRRLHSQPHAVRTT